MTRAGSNARCSRCGMVVDDAKGACPSCGAALAGPAHAVTGTAVLTSPAPGSPTAATRGRPEPPVTHGLAGGFPPGALLAGRYRIVSPLGRGGMGIVYRAEDLKLGQAVALKFLPANLEGNPARVAALHAEVRNARLVSHPNVCRVFDIGDSDGHHFLSMEYVDGEDLASLTKRIGRLPAAKALDLAREICAGLAAAHEQGVIHRDLKPANIMVDGHGRARISDFGLALGFGEAGRTREVAGTPQYMAPEQLAGREASVRSDIYALGLVLYELFVGSRAFEAPTIEELRRQQAEGPRPPSRSAPDVEPAVERAILRCLAADPEARPSSATVVAAALPGGDPLLRAIAAGQTPSPEMVAAAQTEGVISVAGAWGLLGGFAALLALCVVVAPRATLIGLANPRRSPEALAERARAIVAQAAYSAPRTDSVYWFAPDFENLRPGRPLQPTRERPEEGAAGAIRFTFRQSPAALVSFNPLRALSATNPPLTEPGMVTVELDAAGSLRRFQGLPEPPIGGESAPTVDWTPLLSAAGLDDASLTPVDPQSTPSLAFNMRHEWEARRTDVAGPPTRVRGASLGGRPVFFEVAPPGTERRRRSAGGDAARSAVSMLWVVLFFGWLLASAYLGRRNIRAGRGDTRGGLRVAATGAAIAFTSAVLLAHHSYGSPMDFFYWVRTNGASAVWVGLIMWLSYVSLEPYARRHWPHLLIGWSRLFAGRLRDPQVGRDILRGALAGAGFAALHLALCFLGPGVLSCGPQPVGTDLRALLGPGAGLAIALTALGWGLIGSLVTSAFLAVGRALLGRRWLAVAVAGLVVFLSFALRTPPWFVPAMMVASAVLGAVIYLIALLRFGVLTAWATAFVGTTLLSSPIHLDPRSWYAGSSLLTLSIVTAAALYGFITALAGRPLFGAREPGL